VQIQLSDSTMILKVEDTGGPATYKPFRVGEADLPNSDWYNLKISATEIAHESVMTLRAVKLIPVKP
jgi:hypothetical protein